MYAPASETSKQRGAGELVHDAPAAERDRAHDLRVLDRVGEDRLGQLGAHAAGRDRVDPDAVGGPLGGQRAGQLAHARLARRVGHDVLDREQVGAGGDVEDRPAALRPHQARGGLAGEEEPAQVDLEDCVPVVLADLVGRLAHVQAGAVDEDVEPPERGVRVGDHGLHAGDRADVDGERAGVGAGCAQRRGLALQPLRRARPRARRAPRRRAAPARCPARCRGCHRSRAPCGRRGGMRERRPSPASMTG